MKVVEITVFQQEKSRQIVMMEHFYVSIFGKLYKKISEERDLISEVLIICCDFVPCFKYLLPHPNFAFAVPNLFLEKGS